MLAFGKAIKITLAELVLNWIYIQSLYTAYININSAYVDILCTWRGGSHSVHCNKTFPGPHNPIFLEHAGLWCGPGVSPWAPAAAGTWLSSTVGSRIWSKSWWKSVLVCRPQNSTFVYNQKHISLCLSAKFCGFLHWFIGWSGSSQDFLSLAYFRKVMKSIKGKVKKFWRCV